MVAVPGGDFMMGSPEDEPFRDTDEGPRVKVKISPFFMAEVEVSWDEYLAFYAQTSAEGRSTDTEGARTGPDADAITGATPPYGQPDQNWGMGRRPVISVTHHAAQTYCEWLSRVTGKPTAFLRKQSGNMHAGQEHNHRISLKAIPGIFSAEEF